MAIQLDPRARVRGSDRRAAGAAPSAYGASRAPTAQADGAKRRSAHGDGTPCAVTHTQAQHTQRGALIHAAEEKKAQKLKNEAATSVECDATLAAFRVLAATCGERDTYPATWIELVRARLADGFSETDIASALAEASRAPWYREDAGRCTPGFVLGSPDRVAALAALAAQRAPAKRLVRAAVALERAENLPAVSARETMNHAARLLAALEPKTSDHAQRKA